MKSKIKKVFYCEYCNKHGFVEKKMLFHEIQCFKNPENKRPCFNCSSLTKKETVVYYEDYHGFTCEKKVALLYCNEKKHFLYTPQNQIKGNVFCLDDEDNLPMPKTCDLAKKDFFRF